MGRRSLSVVDWGPPWDVITSLETGETSVTFVDQGTLGGVKGAKLRHLTKTDPSLKTFMFVSGWVVLSSSKNKELAFDLANHTISKENTERYFREVGEVPTNSQASHDIEHLRFAGDEVGKFAVVPDWDQLGNELDNWNKRFEKDIVPLLLRDHPGGRGALGEGVRGGSAMRRRLDDLGLLLIAAILVVTLVFLVLPIVVSVMMSFDGREYLGRFPPPDYSVHWYARFFSDAYYLHGLKTSVIIALVATVVSTTAGVSAAIVLDRYEFPGKAALEALFLSPLVVPAVVIGFALLLFFALLGVFDGFTRLLGGHIIITFPYEKRRIPARIDEMLELVKLTGFENRRPAQLSGGQQQRVALARALAVSPEVVLLDEPLSALDAKLRQELRVELKEILSAVGATTIVVTHDQEEAMSLGDSVIVMSEGRIMQQGRPTEIYAES